MSSRDLQLVESAPADNIIATGCVIAVEETHDNLWSLRIETPDGGIWQLAFMRKGGNGANGRRRSFRR